MSTTYITYASFACSRVCVCACSHVSVHVEARVPLISSTLLGHSPLGSLNSELTNLASLASQPALGSPPLPPKCRAGKQAPGSRQLWHGSTHGNVNLKQRMYATNASSTEASPSPLLLMFSKASLMQVKDTVVKSREGLLLRASQTTYTFPGGFNILY